MKTREIWGFVESYPYWRWILEQGLTFLLHDLVPLIGGKEIWVTLLSIANILQKVTAVSERTVQYHACNKWTKVGLYDLTQNVIFQEHLFQLYRLNRRCFVCIMRTFMLPAQGSNPSRSQFRSECKSVNIIVLKTYKPVGK